ncbi:UPF0236 family transposase-like protein [Clostridium coskatii]|uniref:Uncharacterized protein n=1 Tax=Clostridium coskatii TaxID=1705578 RepID=A0A166U3W1_9CLOT|nr:UPF0236 family protein [Clostridium coskatii]OAA94538.1 hypothetical protein WX73_03084 [Clostridium coskatii]OBR93282.1 hypothetical protein CLCOS_27540 [Clostridium coskatii]
MNEIIKLENDRISKYLKGEIKGKKEANILFQEKDGVYLKIQGKKHKQKLKVANKDSNSYQTIGIMYFLGYKQSKCFDDLVNDGIKEIYNKEEIQYTILNGDGALWISLERENNIQKIYQLDLFYIF